MRALHGIWPFSGPGLRAHGLATGATVLLPRAGKSVRDAVGKSACDDAVTWLTESLHLGEHRLTRSQERTPQARYFGLPMPIRRLGVKFIWSSGLPERDACRRRPIFWPLAHTIAIYEARMDIGIKKHGGHDAPSGGVDRTMWMPVPDFRKSDPESGATVPLPEPSSSKFNG